MAEPTLFDLIIPLKPISHGVICGVYLIRHCASGRAYVGSSTNVTRRWQLHRSRLRRGCHGNRYLQNAWSKYGELSFSVGLLAVASESDLRFAERSWIEKLKTCDRIHGFNRAKHPEQCESGWHHTKSACAKMSRARFGKAVHTIQSKNAIRISAIGNARGKGKHFRGRLELDDARRILIRFINGDKVSDIARDFGINSRHVHGIRNGEHWNVDSLSVLRTIASKPRSLVGEKVGTSKLTATNILDIRQRVSDGEARKAVALAYDVKRVTIDHIVRQIIWKHVA